jgi:hypothetical protein
MAYIEFSLLVSFLFAAILIVLLVVLFPNLASMVSVTITLIINDEIIVPSHVLNSLILFLVLNLFKHSLCFLHLYICQTILSS